MHLDDGTLAKAIYGEDVVYERHRHRFEVNNRYLKQISDAGLMIAGLLARRTRRADRAADHPWFVGDAVPPRVHVDSARRPSAVRGFINAARGHARDLTLREPVEATATT